MLKLHPVRVHDVLRALSTDFHCERPMYARFCLRKLISADELSVQDGPEASLLRPILGQNKSEKGPSKIKIRNYIN